MSHIVEAKTAGIVHPDAELLRQAATLVAQRHGGTIETFYLDYYGKRYNAPRSVLMGRPAATFQGLWDPRAWTRRSGCASS